ncbi:MAG: CHAD domain-containing protein [Deltaproteobacteria bacterium]|nr:CHAD domain-containing protein [Deltaproteobacteria bacterium]
MILMKKTPLWIAAKGLLAERGADFFRCWAKTAETFDAEDIHDLRVASRRLREGLTLFAPCYPEERITGIRKSAGKVTDALGDLRNLDEGLAFFREEAAELGTEDGGELADCISLYETNREAARKMLKRRLRKMNPSSLRKVFVRTIHAPYLFDPPPGAIDPFTPIEDFARQSMEIRLAPVLTLVPAARQAEQSAAQHRLRIAVKRFRYRMEVLSPLMEGEGYRELHGHVKEYQELLGRIHDLDVFSDLAKGVGLSEATEQTLGRLIAVKREHSFAKFLHKLDTLPFDAIGASVRSLM